jgi:glycosyltransferase involved in cell wall biosynthesis
LIITVSDDLATMVSQIFSIPKERILYFPLERSPFLDKETSQEIINKRIKDLKGVQYLFYPAQYWPHKNHIRILQALNYINKSDGWCPKLVLVGKDKGNLSMLKDYVKDKGLDANVLFFDFLDYTDFNYLYRHAYAIVMPTYFGPSNIVPLEAWHLKIPLIYSEDLEISQNSGALLINPDNHQDLAKAILEVFKNEVREKQVIEGQRSLEIHNDLFKLKEKDLIHVLKIYEVRMESWQNL